MSNSIILKCELCGSEAVLNGIRYLPGEDPPPIRMDCAQCGSSLSMLAVKWSENNQDLPEPSDVQWMKILDARNARFVIDMLHAASYGAVLEGLGPHYEGKASKVADQMARDITKASLENPPTDSNNLVDIMQMIITAVRTGVNAGSEVSNHQRLSAIVNRTHTT